MWNRDPVYRSLLRLTSEDSRYWFFLPSTRKKESEYKVDVFNSSYSNIQFLVSSRKIVQFIFAYDSNETRRNNVNSIKIHCTCKNNLLLSTPSPCHFYFVHSKRKEKRGLLIINRFKIFRVSKNHEESTLNSYYTIFISL